MGFFGESGAFNAVVKLRQLWVYLANRWILTRYFELRLRRGSLENRALLTQCFKLRQLLVSLANRVPLTRYFVSFEATFVPV